MDRGADLARDDVGQQQVFLVEGAVIALLQIEHAPVGLGDDDRQRELRARVGAVVAAEVVGVEAGVVDHRRAAGAGDATVDAALDRLFQSQEVADLVGQRARRGDHPQDPVGVEPLDHGEVVVEGLVQGADRLAGDAVDRGGAGKRGGKAEATSSRLPWGARPDSVPTIGI